jgi:hypothetical protein
VVTRPNCSTIPPTPPPPVTTPPISTPPIVIGPITIPPIVIPPIAVPPITPPDGGDNGGGDNGGGDDAAKDMTGPGATGTATSPGRQIRQVPLGAVDTGVGDIDGSGDMYYLLAGAVILIGTGAVAAGVIRRNRRNT